MKIFCLSVVFLCLFYVEWTGLFIYQNADGGFGSYAGDESNKDLFQITKQCGMVQWASE